MIKYRSCKVFNTVNSEWFFQIITLTLFFKCNIFLLNNKLIPDKFYVS